jgi:hypothetical protein
MATVSGLQRRWLEAQGFCGYDDETLAEVDVWLRLSPTLCMIWMAVGTILASPVILVALTPFSFLGTIMKGHPFDVIYNHGLRHLFGTRPLPPNGAPRRFACGVATVWLFATALAFQAGAMTAGYVLGYSLTLAALSASTIGFCIPSFFWGLMFGPPTTSGDQTT